MAFSDSPSCYIINCGSVHGYHSGMGIVIQEASKSMDYSPRKEY